VDGGGGTVSCNPAEVVSGGKSICTAVGEAGHVIQGWTGDCASAGTSETCRLKNIQANQSSTVSFSLVAPPQPPQPPISVPAIGLLGLLFSALGLGAAGAGRTRRKG